MGLMKMALLALAVGWVWQGSPLSAPADPKSTVNGPGIRQKAVDWLWDASPEAVAVIEQVSGRSLETRTMVSGTPQALTGNETDRRVIALRQVPRDGAVVIGTVRAPGQGVGWHIWTEDPQGRRHDVACPSCQVEQVTARVLLRNGREAGATVYEESEKTRMHLHYVRWALQVSAASTLINANDCRLVNLQQLPRDGAVVIGTVQPPGGEVGWHIWTEDAQGRRIDVACSSCRVTQVMARVWLRNGQDAGETVYKDQLSTRLNLRYAHQTIRVHGWRSQWADATAGPIRRGSAT
jgi:hypothetical protein